MRKAWRQHFPLPTGAYTLTRRPRAQGLLTPGSRGSRGVLGRGVGTGGRLLRGRAGAEERRFSPRLRHTREAVRAALADDFDTPAALDAVTALIHRGNAELHALRTQVVAGRVLGRASVWGLSLCRKAGTPPPGAPGGPRPPLTPGAASSCMDFPAQGSRAQTGSVVCLLILGTRGCWDLRGAGGGVLGPYLRPPSLALLWALAPTPWVRLCPREPVTSQRPSC